MNNELRDLRSSEIEAAARALVTARATNLGIEVDTNVTFSSGHSVTVVVTKSSNDFEVHDASFGSMHLVGNGVKINEKARKRIALLVQEYGCDFIDGRVSIHCDFAHISVAIVMAANASRSVGDYANMVRKNSIRDFKKEVETTVLDIIGSGRVRIDEKVVGDSGTEYRMNLAILDKNASRPIAFIETLAEQNSVNNRFRAFYDIKSNINLGSIPRLAVYDDRQDWRTGDLLLLQDVSNPVPFSLTKTRVHGLLS